MSMQHVFKPLKLYSETILLVQNNNSLYLQPMFDEGDWGLYLLAKINQLYRPMMAIALHAFPYQIAGIPDRL